MGTYNPGQSAILPPRLWSEPGVVDWATVRFVDDIDRCVRIRARGEVETVSFEELDAAAEAVAQ